MSFYHLLLCLFVSVLALLQVTNAQHSKYRPDFTCVTIMIQFLLLENSMNQRVLDTNCDHLIKLKLKRFSEKGIKNILLALMFSSSCLFLFLFLFFLFFFNWAKLTATRVKLLRPSP